MHARMIASLSLLHARLRLLLPVPFFNLAPPSLPLPFCPPPQPPLSSQVSNPLSFIVLRCPASFATPAAICPPASSPLIHHRCRRRRRRVYSSTDASHPPHYYHHCRRRRIPCRDYIRRHLLVERRHGPVNTAATALITAFLAAVAASTIFTSSSPRPPHHRPAG